MRLLRGLDCNNLNKSTSLTLGKTAKIPTQRNKRRKVNGHATHRKIHNLANPERDMTKGWLTKQSTEDMGTRILVNNR